MFGALVALLVAGAAAWVAVEATRDETTATPRPDIEGTGGFVEPPEEEEWGDVHFTFEAERDDDDTFLNVYFVRDAPPSRILTAAKKCVKEYLPEHLGVSCYGFDTEEALEFAEPDPDTGGMEHRCWRAYFSDSDTAHKGTGVEAANLYETEGCP